MRLQTKEKVDRYLGFLLMILFKPLARVLGVLMHRDHRLELRSEAAFIKLAGGGSLVLAYPALLGLKRKHPHCRLILICTPRVTHFGTLLGVFDEIRVIDDSSLKKFFLSALKVWRQSFRIDTIIDLEAYGRLTTVFSLVTAARNRISFFLRSAFWRFHISTHLIFFNRFSGAHYFYEQLCALYDAEPASLEECRAALRKLHPGLGRRGVRAEGAAKRVGVGHSCSDLSPERMLAPAQWPQFLSGSIPPDAEVEFHFFGGSGDAAPAEEIISFLRPVFTKGLFLNHCGRFTLAESLVHLAAMDEFWGIDSALLHAARLFLIPATSFWGPTDPQVLLMPIPGYRERVVYDKVACSPCVHLTSEPPCGGNNICIKNLSRPAEERQRNPLWVVIE